MPPKRTAVRWAFKSELFATSNSSNMTARFLKEFESEHRRFQGSAELLSHRRSVLTTSSLWMCRTWIAYHEFISHKLAAMDNIGTVQSSFVMSEVLER